MFIGHAAGAVFISQKGPIRFMISTEGLVDMGRPCYGMMAFHVYMQGSIGCYSISDRRDYSADRWSMWSATIPNMAHLKQHVTPANCLVMPAT